LTPNELSSSSVSPFRAARQDRPLDSTTTRYALCATAPPETPHTLVELTVVLRDVTAAIHSSRHGPARARRASCEVRERGGADETITAIASPALSAVDGGQAADRARAAIRAAPPSDELTVDALAAP
jgi:hypothetical protein